MTYKIWDAVLDELYQCEVVRTQEYRGLLTIKNTQNGHVILEQEIGISYDAQFGPDIGDVAYWQDICVNKIDELGSTLGTY